MVMEAVGVERDEDEVWKPRVEDDEGGGDSSSEVFKSGREKLGRLAIHKFALIEIRGDLPTVQFAHLNCIS